MSKEEFGAIIFSRYDSTRLYGKALKDINGKCLLQRVIERTKLINGIDKIIVATSERNIDEPIVRFSEKSGVEVFRGKCDDVYDRAIKACKKFHFNSFVRICGDRPFFDFELISKGVDIFKKSNSDIVTTMFPRTYPPGLTTEIINTNLLEKYKTIIKSKFDREHLTTFFYENHQNLKIINIDNENFQTMNSLSLVVDTKNDLDRARYIASHEKNKLEIIPINLVIKLAKEYDASITIE